MLKSIFKWLLGVKEQGSSNVATKRMKLMVIHDREQISGPKLDRMKAELLEVMSKYFDVDPENAECIIRSHDDRSSFISANVPVIKKKTPKPPKRRPAFTS